MSEWSEWTWEYAKQSCGSGERNRTIEVHRAHGGRWCADKYNCTIDCLEQNQTINCPGVYNCKITHICNRAIRMYFLNLKHILNYSYFRSFRI